MNINQKTPKNTSRSEIIEKNMKYTYINNNNISDEFQYDNINNISIEKDTINKIDNNQKLILNKNKSKKKSKLNQNLKTLPSHLDLKNKLKYKEDDNDIIPSSYRKFQISQNEKETRDYSDDFKFYNINKINNDATFDYEDKLESIKTEEDLIEKKSKNGIINEDDLFKKIISINLNININNEELNMFFFNKIPKNETFVSNINIINNPSLFNYNLEIITNNKIYFFAKIIKYFPQMKIKIYYSENYNNINNMNYSQVSNIEPINNSNFVYVGKIISNITRTHFIVYIGNKKNNYAKNLEISYSWNIFGLLGAREMKINKYHNNNIDFSLCNDKPEWDYQYNNYKMNFNGRVKQASKKNFILIENLNNNSIKNINKNDDSYEIKNILQCGKIDDKTYTLDFISPLSPFEAFCISITSLVTKISCE